MIDTIQNVIKGSKSIVYFGGAGTSTESEIPDYRTAGGLYSRDKLKGRSPEELLHINTLQHDPEIFYQFYRNHMIYPHAVPNQAHRVLAKWEKEGRLAAVITQNIDGLHQLAGSRQVLELHGSVYRNYCMNCHRQARLENVLDSRHAVPRCEKCNGMIRPDVVLYGESLDEDVIQRAIGFLTASDFLIIGGTSLAVYPAAGLLRCFNGPNLLIINREPTPFDQRARWVIREAIGSVLSRLDRM